MFDDLRELYQEVILDHGKHPRNYRHPADANREAQGDNPVCGDRLIVYLTLDDSGIVKDCGFVGQGCAISTASASMMTEVVVGKHKDEVLALFHHFHDLCTKDEDQRGDHGPIDQDALDRLIVLSGVRQFPVRVKCATLPWHTLVAAIEGEVKTSTE